MRHLLNLRIVLGSLAILLAIFGVSNWFVAVFVPARNEVVYHYDVTVSYCTGGDCVYHAKLRVANTGREMQRAVVVTVAGLPPDTGASPHVLNLDASYPRESNPVIERAHENGMLTIRLRDFAPGTLIEFSVSGFLPESRLRQALEPEVKVTGKGRIVEGDPRAIAFGRFFSQGFDGRDPAFPGTSAPVS